MAVRLFVVAVYSGFGCCRGVFCQWEWFSSVFERYLLGVSRRGVPFAICRTKYLILSSLSRTLLKNDTCLVHLPMNEP